VIEVRVEVRPKWYFRLPGNGADGLMRRRGPAVQRWIRLNGHGVLMAAVQPAADRVVVAARSDDRAAAEEGVKRMRFAIGVDDDLRAFHERFRDDRYIGQALRARPHLRIRRRPEPWEALQAAITEQLIAFEDAVVIQRRMIARLGAQCPRTGMRDSPKADEVARVAPAQLCAFDLAPKRALAMRKVAEQVARGTIDLSDHAADRRLLRMREIGPWTCEMLATFGQGRFDAVPAGDLGYLKLVGRIKTGDPQARVEEPEVREFFERYGEWKGLAGEYLRLAATLGTLPIPGPRPPARSPHPAGTRWSPRSRPRVAA
jgi:3-methyladenine DNA glycosylase/8-oxoguanine DNA glycosylase